MEKLLPILTVLIFATAGWAQVTPGDYQAWRRAERAAYATLDDAVSPLRADASDPTRLLAERNEYRGSHSDVYQTRLAAERNNYRGSHGDVYQTRLAAERNNYRGSHGDVYQAPLAAEQENLRDGYSLAYHAWRHSEQAVHRLTTARDRGPVLAIVDP